MTSNGNLQLLIEPRMLSPEVYSQGHDITILILGISYLLKVLG